MENSWKDNDIEIENVTSKFVCVLFQFWYTTAYPFTLALKNAN